MGAIVHPTGGLNARDLQEFPAALRCGLASARQVGIPRRFWDQHGGYTIPQCAASSSTNIRRRWCSSARPAIRGRFTASARARISFPIRAKQHAIYRHELRLSQHRLDGRIPASRLCDELERRRAVSARGEQLTEVDLSGIGRRRSSRKLEHQFVPHQLRSEQSGPACRRFCSARKTTCRTRSSAPSTTCRTLATPPTTQARSSS